MVVIGLVGGVASGKSLVARQLAQLGAVVLDADRVGHEVLRDPDVQRAIRERWGREVFGADGHVDRQAMAGIVFRRSAEGLENLAYLEQLTHPKIKARLQEMIAELADRGSVKAAVLDAPVMLKAGWDKLCDVVLFVHALRAQRRDRALHRGWNEDDFAAREAAQESLNEKRRRADLVIDNSGSPEQTFAQVQQFWRSLA